MQPSPADFGVDTAALERSAAFVVAAIGLCAGVGGGALYLRSLHDAAVWTSPECALMSWSLLACAALAACCVLLCVALLSVRTRPTASVLVACAALVALTALAYCVGRALVATVVDAALEARVRALLPFDTSSMPAFSLAACGADNAIAQYARAAALVLPVLIILVARSAWFLRSAAIILIPLYFYSAVFWFFTRQRVYLGLFAVLLVLVNVKAAFRNALGEQPHSMTSDYFPAIANAGTDAKKDD
jgi:hypothetical protein